MRILLHLLKLVMINQVSSCCIQQPGRFFLKSGAEPVYKGVGLKVKGALISNILQCLAQQIPICNAGMGNLMQITDAIIIMQM